MIRCGEVNKEDEVALTKMAAMKRRAEIWTIFGYRVAVVADGAAAKLKAPLSRSTDNSDGRNDGEIPKRVARGYETSRDENTDNRDWQKQIRRTFSPSHPAFHGCRINNVNTPRLALLPNRTVLRGGWRG